MGSLFFHREEKRTIRIGELLSRDFSSVNRRRPGHTARSLSWSSWGCTSKWRYWRAGEPVHASLGVSGTIPTAVHMRSRGNPLDNIIRKRLLIAVEYSFLTVPYPMDKWIRVAWNLQYLQANIAPVLFIVGQNYSSSAFDTLWRRSEGYYSFGHKTLSIYEIDALEQNNLFE